MRLAWLVSIFLGASIFSQVCQREHGDENPMAPQEIMRSLFENWEHDDAGKPKTPEATRKISVTEETTSTDTTIGFTIQDGNATERDGNLSTNATSNASESMAKGNSSFDLIRDLLENAGFQLREPATPEPTSEVAFENGTSLTQPAYPPFVTDLLERFEELINYFPTADPGEAESPPPPTGNLIRALAAASGMLTGCSESIDNAGCLSNWKAEDLSAISTEFLQVLYLQYFDKAYRERADRLKANMERCARLLSSFYLNSGLTAFGSSNCHACFAQSPEQCLDAQVLAYGAIRWCISHDTQIKDDLAKNCSHVQTANHPACTRDIIRVCSTEGSVYEQVAQNLSAQIDLVGEYSKVLLDGDYEISNAAAVRQKVNTALDAFMNDLKARLEKKPFLPRHFRLTASSTSTAATVDIKAGDLTLSKLTWPRHTGLCRRVHEKRACDTLEVTTTGGQLKVETTFEMKVRHRLGYAGDEHEHSLKGHLSVSLADFRFQFPALMQPAANVVSEPFCCSLQIKQAESEFVFLMSGEDYVMLPSVSELFSAELLPHIQEYVCGAVLKGGDNKAG